MLTILLFIDSFFHLYGLGMQGAIHGGLKHNPYTYLRWQKYGLIRGGLICGEGAYTWFQFCVNKKMGLSARGLIRGGGLHAEKYGILSTISQGHISFKGISWSDISNLSLIYCAIYVYFSQFSHQNTKISEMSGLGPFLGFFPT